MTLQAALNLSLQVASGASISVSYSMDAAAWDHVSVRVKNDKKTQAVALQPGGGDSILLIVLTSSTYDDQITYKLAGGPAKAFTLNSPQLISGADIVNAISKKPTSIDFVNGSKTEISVDVYVVRKAS